LLSPSYSANPGLIVATVGAYSENANTLSEMLNDGEIRRPQPVGNHQRRGAVAELVGIGGGVVSGVINLESSGVEASDWRPRHDEPYHEA
jgi:hypothetical protein